MSGPEDSGPQHDSQPSGGGDWQSLVKRASGGDETARGELVERFYPRVQTIVHRQLQSDFRKNHKWMLPLFSTRDVVQEVFVRVANGLGEQELDFPDEEAFVAYLSTVVRNRLLDAVRFHEAGKRDVRRVAQGDGPGERTHHLESANDPDATPALAASLSEQADVLRDVLESFPERHRELLTMRIVDDEAFPAIASRLGYASAETARQSFLDVQAKLLVRLRSRGVRPPGETLC